MSDPEPKPPGRRRPQFGLGAMMVTMAMLSVLSAGVAKLWGDATEDRLIGVVLIVGGPMGVMIAYSLVRQLVAMRARHRVD